MFYIRCLKLIWLVPCSWIDAFIVRKKPFEIRYEHMHRWSKRFMHAFHVSLHVLEESPLPKDVPILFVCNHQSEFDMLIQMAAISLPFSFISKMENKKLPYVGSWSKTLDVLFFDRDDRSSAIHMLREASRRLKAKKHMLIYPEGTRSKGRKMHPLQPGSLQPAFMAKADVVCMVLENSYAYKNVFRHASSFTMHILKPIPYAEYKTLKADGLAQKLEKEMQEILDHTVDESYL